MSLGFHCNAVAASRVTFSSVTATVFLRKTAVDVWNGLVEEGRGLITMALYFLVLLARLQCCPVLDGTNMNSTTRTNTFRRLTVYGKFADAARARLRWKSHAG